MIQTFSQTKGAIRQRKLRLEHPEVVSSYQKKHYEANKEKCKAKHKAWVVANDEYIHQYWRLESKIRYWAKKDDMQKVAEFKLQMLQLQSSLENRQTWSNFFAR